METVHTPGFISLSPFNRICSSSSAFRHPDSKSLMYSFDTSLSKINTSSEFMVTSNPPLYNLRMGWRAISFMRPSKRLLLGVRLRRIPLSFRNCMASSDSAAAIPCCTSSLLSGTFLAVAALQPAAASRPLTDSLTVASGLLASESVATPAPVTAQPESETDSIAQLRLRLQRKYIESTLATDGLTVIDTLATDNDAVQVVHTLKNTFIVKGFFVYQ